MDQLEQQGTNAVDSQDVELRGKNLVEILPPETLERIVQQTIADRDAGKKDYEANIEPKLILRQKAYRSDKDDLKARFPKLEQIIDLSDSSCQDTVESIMPSLMRIFHSSSKPLSLQGVTEEDDGPAKVHEDLIDWQLNRKNKYWLASHDWLKITLIENFGILKVYWKRETEVKRFESVFDMNELAALTQDKNVTVEQQTEVSPGIFQVVYQVSKYTANYPIIESMPNSEFYLDPDARTVWDAAYAIHHKPVTMDYLRRQEKAGKFVDIDKVREAGGQAKKTAYETSLNPKQTKSETSDKGRKEHELYECYEKISLNEDDEILTDLIVVLVGDIPVRIEVNTMGGHPFIPMTANRDPHRVHAFKGIMEMVREIQDLKTVLLLQMVIATCVTNDRQMFVDANRIVDVSELERNEKVVQCDGAPRDIVQFSPAEPFAPQTLQLAEYAHQMLENRVGITRYNQGTDTNSLNKTATGLTAIMQAANQRIEQLARICAETGFTELFKRLIYLNQTFIDQETVLRVTNERLVVRPDDLQGDIDIIVNSGIGTGTKQAEEQSLQMLLQMYPQLVQGGIADRAHVSYVMGKLVELMGFKNVDDFIKTPEAIRLEDQQQQAVMAAGIGPGGVPQGIAGTGANGPGGGIDPRVQQLLAMQAQGQAAQ